MKRATSRVMLEAVRRSGYRMTSQRKKVFDFLESQGESHPSASQVFAKLRSADPAISVSTVYNTLKTLVGLGLLKVLEFDSSENRYEVNLEPHINLVCKACGTISDFTGALLTDPAGLDAGGAFKVSDLRAEYYGICGECRTAAGPDSGAVASLG